MEQVACPACGLQMNVDTFTNCPNCHTLIESAPAPATEPPTDDVPEPPPDAPGALEPEQPA
jgi:hypothetical protein